MGAPKQRWTPEEEAALKAGVAKHGPGKWRTILRDPDFSQLLRIRSNVDLKDKWRNLSVTAGGYGSREKARMALKKGRHVVPMLTAGPMEVDGKDMNNALDTVVEAEPLTMALEALPIEQSPDKSVARLDDLILEAIREGNEPSGSNKADIATYIEDRYWPPDDFQVLLSTKLKSLVNSGKIIKVNQKYRIAPSSRSGRTISTKPSEGMNAESNNAKRLTKPQVVAELEKMKGMTREEAAAFAAKAVAEAEVAIAEAEEAARVAEAAENDAEAAKAFLDAVTVSMRNRNAASMILRAC